MKKIRYGQDGQEVLVTPVAALMKAGESEDAFLSRMAARIVPEGVAFDFVEAGYAVADRRSHEQVWEAIKAIRLEKEAGGFAVEIDGELHWFNSDALSRVKLLALKAEGDRLAEGLRWKTLANDFIALTPARVALIAEAALAHDAAVFAAAEAHRQAMMGMTDASEYDEAANWPQTYEEWRAQAVAHAAGTAETVVLVQEARASAASVPVSMPVAMPNDAGAAGVDGVVPNANETLATLLAALQAHLVASGAVKG